MKICNKCLRELDPSCFNRKRDLPDGLDRSCRECVSQRRRSLRKQNPALYSRIATAHTLRRKQRIISHYSDGTMKCVACGFTDIRALTIDHIHSNGASERRLVGVRGQGFYRWLISQGFPEGYQVLCMNCQWIKRHAHCEHH